MTPEETVDLLTVAAAFDQRTVGEGDAMAWFSALFDVSFADAKVAVIAHYTDSTDRLMPAHVRQRVKAMRRKRLAFEIPAAPSHEIADEPGRYKHALEAEIRKIADGRSVQKAIAAPVREDGPPEGWVEARKAFGEALGAVGNPLTPQEIARRQAAESRAARGAPADAEPEQGEPAA